MSQTPLSTCGNETTYDCVSGSPNHDLGDRIHMLLHNHVVKNSAASTIACVIYMLTHNLTLPAR